MKDTQQLVNPHNLELIRGICEYIRNAEQHYSEQQIPAPQQPVHLMMAGWTETCSDRQRENNEGILTGVVYRRQQKGNANLDFLRNVMDRKGLFFNDEDYDDDDGGGGGDDD
jgi:hypothetical protein